MVSSQSILPCSYVMIAKQFGMEPETFGVRVFKWLNNWLDRKITSLNLSPKKKNEERKLSSLNFATWMHELGCKLLVHILMLDMIPGSDLHLKFRKILLNQNDNEGCE